MDPSDTNDRGSVSGELPADARVEDITRYVTGGFHPIHLGDRMGQDERFEVHHKLGHTDTCTVWLCLDHQNQRHVGVKVFQARKSIESHPEIEALQLFEGVSREELRSNRIFTIEEHFWIDGPNGRHLCFVVPVLGPPISYGLPGMDLDTPDLLTDLCLQASQTLKYLHDKKICHGDFRPDHMRMQLNSDAMSRVKIYDLFGEPKVWYLNDYKNEDGGRRPHYLVEPARVAGLEEKYRTGKIAVDSFSAAYRENDATKPKILDVQYTPPEIRFLKKSSGFSSDIWSLASTIHLVRTSKRLLASLDSKSSLVSWLAWAYGPFPQGYWNAVGEHLTSDSAVPVFTANTIPQGPPTTPEGHYARQVATDPAGYPREWGEHRKRVVAPLLGDEETPRSIQQRELLQEKKDRSKYLRIKLPRDSKPWTNFQVRRKRLTGFESLLHKDLSKERQWYEDTDALNGKVEDMPRINPSAKERVRMCRRTMPAALRIVMAKRPRTGDDGAQPTPKRAKLCAAEHDLRDLVERVERDDGRTKLSCRLQPGEVDLLASLLRDMLKNDSSERIDVDEVVRHGWFAESRKRLA
ncbi:putative cmgc protein kinase [Rosellinia necatrix]|uniref:non-specific serine/threonine protein kinase n=1 Tax=Rosellinia necatrix TaxID=77044 RepID=A0A1W2TJP0_ROSNE|nr:putative cmgc protein kinase [Rosellinia necatrix]